MKSRSIFLCLFVLSVYGTTAQPLNTADSLALVDIYNSTGGALWSNSDNWLSSSPASTWYGVEVTDSSVTGLQLGANNLSGTLPASIGNLKKLQYLWLYSNSLSGTVPTAIGNCTLLTDLLAGSNQLSGSLPAGFVKLVNLVNLDLSNNNFSGSLPAAINSLVKLQSFNLSQNHFTGNIPLAIGKLTQLQNLQLSDNQFTGSLPSSINKLTQLQYFYCQNNQLSGSIPGGIGNLTNLQYLYLDHNQLSGAIPNAITNLVNLQLLFLNNNQLTGSLPSAMNKLTSLTYLYLNNNLLEGALPSSLSSLNNLQYLYLNNNNFTQTLNTALPLPANIMVNADITNNRFTFNGLELMANNYPFFNYSPQASLPIHSRNDTLYVTAGGSIANNTYQWYRVGDTVVASMPGDSGFHPTANGLYYATVTNAQAPKLLLRTDTVSFTLTPALVKAEIKKVTITQQNATTVYPNPARDVVHVQYNGTATFLLTNSVGKIVLRKVIANNDIINVSSFSAGNYFLKNETTGEVKQVIVIN